MPDRTAPDRGGEPEADDFLRVAVSVPAVRVADPTFNAAATIGAAREAAKLGAGVVAFPELGLTAYSVDDLFHQDALLDAAAGALASVVEASGDLNPVIMVGVPWRTEQKLFNLAVVIHRGRVLGAIPKSYLPNYREFYEKRQFAAARDLLGSTIRIAGAEVPCGADLIFDATDVDDLGLHVEICEDVWVPVPPSTYAAMAGATVLVNLSASNAAICKDGYRRQLSQGQSARLIAAYLYTSGGFGESTTDLAWDGHALIAENGDLLAETRRFGDRDQLLVADVDLGRLRQDRMRMTSYTDCATDHRSRVASLRRVPFELGAPSRHRDLRRFVPRFPFVPADPATLDSRCADAYHSQVQGLQARLAATGIERVVIGVSGGLDSTQALLVAGQAMDALGLPRTNVLGYSMPGFGTSTRTRTNARRIMEALGITTGEIDISASAQRMLADIGHPAARGEPVHDITYENVQAGERTSHLFRLANFHGGLVVGTGDLSELALGWCTYGVGDHMSHYNVNASVPKTLMQSLIRWTAGLEAYREASEILESIVETEISPELIPTSGGDGLGQRTEELVGPYDLHDFFLYYTLRYGYSPAKILRLAELAWSDPDRGRWPPLIPDHRRRAYDRDEISRWLRVFLTRFFATSQFKRSALPNGPKIGSTSLSPRGDWRAPSDATAAPWLDALWAAGAYWLCT